MGEGFGHLSKNKLAKVREGFKNSVNDKTSSRAMKFVASKLFPAYLQSTGATAIHNMNWLIVRLPHFRSGGDAADSEEAQFEKCFWDYEIGAQ